MNRYTKKQLDELSDVKFAQLILQERLNSLTNPYSPLSIKLRCAIQALNTQEEHSSGEYHTENAKSISENKAELFKLIQDNPDLPIVPMVDYEIVAEDSGRWLGSWGSSYIGEYLVGEERVHFREDDDPYEVARTVEEELDDEAWGVMSDEEYQKAYASLPWIKAIIVNIDLPG